MKRILLGLAALVAVVGSAIAAGNFPDWPVVGKPAYCYGTSTGASGNQVCTTTVPAGPSVITGFETIPADTNKANGAQPATVLLTMAALNALPYQYALSPANAATITVLATSGKLVVDPSATMASLGVQLPAASAMQDGQLFSLSSSKTITALTVAGGTGTTVSNAPTILTVSTTGAFGYQWIYKSLTATTGTYFRLQ